MTALIMTLRANGPTIPRAGRKVSPCVPWPGNSHGSPTRQRGGDATTSKMAKMAKKAMFRVDSRPFSTLVIYMITLSVSGATLEILGKNEVFRSRGQIIFPYWGLVSFGNVLPSWKKPGRHLYGSRKHRTHFLLGIANLEGSLDGWVAAGEQSPGATQPDAPMEKTSTTIYGSQEDPLSVTDALNDVTASTYESLGHALSTSTRPNRGHVRRPERLAPKSIASSSVRSRIGPARRWLRGKGRRGMLEVRQRGNKLVNSGELIFASDLCGSRT